jgi:hypothetical protein
MASRVAASRKLVHGFGLAWRPFAGISGACRRDA